MAFRMATLIDSDPSSYTLTLNLFSREVRTLDLILVEWTYNSMDSIMIYFSGTPECFEIRSPIKEYCVSSDYDVLIRL